MNLKTKKLSITIPRRNLPKFDTTIEPSRAQHLESLPLHKKFLLRHNVTLKLPKNVFFLLNEIFTYDHLFTNPLFSGAFTTATHDKSKLVAELEKYLISSAMTETNEMNRALGHLCAHIG